MAHFHISVSLVNCEAVGVSKPSISSLVKQIMRQQDLRCPFLVISGGSECYHNPLSCSLLSPLFLSPLSHLYFPSVAYICTTLSSLLCICASILLFYWPFYAPVALCPPSSSLWPSLWPSLWSYCGLALCLGDWTVRDDVQGKPQLIKSELDC